MLHDDELTTERREFLSRLAVGTAAFAAAGVIPNVAHAAPAMAPTTPNAPWSDAWLDQIKGKHRQVFDAFAVNSGFPFAYARVFLLSNQEAYNLPESELTAVIVMRHAGIPLAMNDTIWSKYKLGEAFNVINPKTKEPATKNPFYKPAAGELPLPGMEADKLTASGVILCACNVALTIQSAAQGAKIGVAADKAKEEWAANLLPGVVLVPSGVLALNRAQEKGCTYCSAA